MGTKVQPVDRIKYQHYSTTESFEKCPYQWWLRYVERLDTLDEYNASDALRLGTALHRGIETDAITAITEYYDSYPIMTDEQVTEAMVVEYWIKKAKETLPDGQHEVQMENDWFQGTIDLLVPATKYDTMVPGGTFDMYDFKYSNNVDRYMESKQLHVYKSMFERIYPWKKIRKMFFVFFPKVNLKREKYEDLQHFRNRIMAELETKEIIIKEVPYNSAKFIDFLENCAKMDVARRGGTAPKHPTALCHWCQYEAYCKEGETYMLLPSTTRRQIGQTTKRKLWIYGGAFSGKTTFCDSAPNPLELNTDGNVNFVTMPYIAIKDQYEGRQKVLAWKIFKDAIEELEKGDNDFETIIVDLLEDTYESCRLYMYAQLGITHESDDSFRAWDKVRTEYLSTMRRFFNMDYQNLIAISHEDTSKDITKKSGDRITSIKPNIADKVANKIAGMVDIVARVIVEEDGTRYLDFKSDEVVFGGGRMKGIKETRIPLDWNELCRVYEEANESAVPQKQANPKPEEAPAPKPQPKEETPKTEPVTRSRRETKATEPVEEMTRAQSEPDTEAPRRRTRKSRAEALPTADELDEKNLPW